MLRYGAIVSSEGNGRLSAKTYSRIFLPPSGKWLCSAGHQDRHSFGYRNRAVAIHFKVVGAGTAFFHTIQQYR